MIVFVRRGNRPEEYRIRSVGIAHGIFRAQRPAAAFVSSGFADPLGRASRVQIMSHKIKTPSEVSNGAPKGVSCVIIPVSGLPAGPDDAKIQKFPPPQILDQKNNQLILLRYFYNRNGRIDSGKG